MEPLRSSIDSPVFVAIIVMIVAMVAVPSSAQVGVSARIEGMGPDFAGLIDDPISDASLNPARLGAIEGTQLFVGYRRSSNSRLRFPGLLSSYRNGSILPVEGYSSSFGSIGLDDTYYVARNALVVTLFKPMGDDIQASFTLDLATDGNDTGNTSSTFRESSRWVSSGIAMVEGATRRRRDSHNYLFDAAMSSTRVPDAKAWGARVRTIYVSFDNDDLRSDTFTEAPVSDPTQQVQDFRLIDSGEAYEEFAANLTMGLFRPSGSVREVTLALGVRRISGDGIAVTQVIFDEDLDNDGLDPDGFSPRYEFEEFEFESGRDISGGDVAARVVLSHGDRVRSSMRVGVQRLTGDGETELHVDDVVVGFGVDREFRANALHTYDTDVTRLNAAATVVYQEELRHDVLIALAANALYRLDKYEENGSGTGSILDRDGGVGTSVESNYEQAIDMERDDVRVRFSFAAEWTLEKYLTFRTGVFYEASRISEESITTVDVDDEGLFATPKRSIYSQVDYNTLRGIRAGLSVRLADRLFVDLYSTSFSFASYTYGTIRFVL